MKTFNKITISFTLLICLLFSYSLLYQVYLEQTGPIYDNTLRFHVRADSDKKEAQERKLIVRDAVLRYVKEDVYRADSAQELKQNLAEKTEEIAQVAANASDGKPVRVYFTKERFPIRHYGTAIFPAGEYQALRVDIGKAAGHNWWCAFYPTSATPRKKTLPSPKAEKNSGKRSQN
jgi:stage II sporulation protein R